MSSLTKPLGTTASIAFIAICIAVMLAVMAICQQGYLRDFPNASDNVSPKGHCAEDNKTNVSLYGFSIPLPIAIELSDDGTSEPYPTSARHRTKANNKSGKFLFNYFIGSFLR